MSYGGKMNNPYMVKPHLDGDSFTYNGDDIGFVFVHGFTATTTEVRTLANYFHSLGHTVAAPLLPGHGNHPDELNQTNWQDWYQAVLQSYHEIKPYCKEVWLGGESMGALLCLQMAANIPGIAGLMLFSPALVIRNLKAAYLLQYFKKYLDKSHKSDEMDWKGYNVYPLRGTVQLLKLQKEVIRSMPKVTQPTLVVVSKADKTVSLETGEKIIGSISSKHKELIVMEESPHVMLLGQESERIFEHAERFFADNNSTVTYQ